MQQPMMDAAAQQSNIAAMMFQMQMASPAPVGFGGMGGMMPPFYPTMQMGAMPTQLMVRVDGLKFEYQLTEDDVRKVFTRYGGVSKVDVDREGTKATVTFDQPHQAMAAQHDLDRKQLAGMSGAYLRVEFQAAPATYDPSLAMAAAVAAGTTLQAQTYDPSAMAMAAAAGAAGSWANPLMNAAASMQGYPTIPVPPLDGTAAGGASGAPSSPGGGGRPKKYTCKLDVGIENENEFRVGSRVIQIARQIWQDPRFQEFGGKTRLRGKGIGGPHEADEPLALCISCREQEAFDKAVGYAEAQLAKVHADYKAFCMQKGRPVPELSVKVLRKGQVTGSGQETRIDAQQTSSPPSGERPANAPNDDEIQELIESRNEARKAANFKKADEVRDYLKSRGVVLMDEKGAKGNFQGKEVTKWRFWRP